LTIRNLTTQGQKLGSIMNVITIKRTVSRAAKNSKIHRSFRELTRNFLVTENHWAFAIEALLFGALLAISAWPIVSAAGAINALL
jgi:hypothetical protein